MFGLKKSITHRELVQNGYDADGQLVEQRRFQTDNKPQRDDWASNILLSILEDHWDEAIRDPVGFSEKIFTLADAMVEESRKRCES